MLYIKYYNLLKRLQQGSPTWCPRAPGRPQGSSRLSAGMGVAPGDNSRQISSMFCRFVLWEVWSQTKYSSSLNVKIFGPPKQFGLAMLPPAGCSKNNISVNNVLTLRNILTVNAKII